MARELAERQHGVFARRQLVALGIASKRIDGWLETRRIERVHRGLYAFSERLLSREGHWMAAVLAIGRDAVLSHRSAAALWGIRPYPGGPAEVTTVRKVSRRLGIAVHCVPFARDEAVLEQGIPTTTASRTLLDIAGLVRPYELDRAMREAEYLRLSGGPPLTELIERYPGKAGIASARRLIDRGWSGSPTREELEARFVDFIDEHDLLGPERNALIHLGTRRFEVDFLWRRSRLVVELDGYAGHATRHAFEDDRERDRLLQLAGFRVVRVTWRQLHRNGAALARDLSSLLHS